MGPEPSKYAAAAPAATHDTSHLADESSSPAPERHVGRQREEGIGVQEESYDRHNAHDEYSARDLARIRESEQSKLGFVL
jgi:hypothetical protein